MSTRRKIGDLVFIPEIGFEATIDLEYNGSNDVCQHECGDLECVEWAMLTMNSGRKLSL